MENTDFFFFWGGGGGGGGGGDYTSQTPKPEIVSSDIHQVYDKKKTQLFITRTNMSNRLILKIILRLRFALAFSFQFENAMRCNTFHSGAATLVRHL